jgi:hypothetical protein
MLSSLNGEEETRQIRRTKSQGEYFPNPIFDREFRQKSGTSECESLGVNRNDGSPRVSRFNNTRERIAGGILRQLIKEYRDQVAINKNEVSRLEKRIIELELLEQELIEEYKE